MGEQLTLIEAVRVALARAMHDDDSVVVLGEDVGINGGVFRATDGLVDDADVLAVLYYLYLWELLSNRL